MVLAIDRVAFPRGLGASWRRIRQPRGLFVTVGEQQCRCGKVDHAVVWPMIAVQFEKFPSAFACEVEEVDAAHVFSEASVCLHIGPVVHGSLTCRWKETSKWFRGSVRHGRGSRLPMGYAVLCGPIAGGR